MAITATWVLAAMAIAAAALASTAVGKPAWWLGGPVALGFLPLPFVAPGAAIIAVRRWPRHSPWVGVLCSIVTGGFAFGDVVNSPGIAVVMGAVAMATVLASLASFAGRQQRGVTR